MNLSGVIHLNRKGICILCGLLIFFIYMFTNAYYSMKQQIIQHEKINLKQLLKISIDAAINGGYEVVTTKDNLNIQSKGKTKEGLIDSVTTADFLSHCAILTTLKQQYPRLNVISEEAKTECQPKQQQQDLTTNSDGIIEKLPEIYENQQDVIVWIDPLDATYEYTEKLYKYVTTMVCVSVRGEPIIGVIHKPFDKTTSWAWVGKAQSSDLKTNIPKPGNKEKLKIIISRSHSGDVKDLLKKQFDNYEIIEAAGAGYKALEVVNGKVDAYIHITAIKKWDICAGNAIINAVGGKMTTKHGNLIDYSDIVHSKNDDGLVATLHNHEKFIETS